MAKYIGKITLESVGTRNYSIVKRLCKLESEVNPSNFGYYADNGKLRFAFNESSCEDAATRQLLSIMEATKEEVKPEEEKDGDDKEPGNTGKNSADSETLSEVKNGLERKDGDNANAQAVASKNVQQQASSQNNQGGNQQASDTAPAASSQGTQEQNAESTTNGEVKETVRENNGAAAEAPAAQTQDSNAERKQRFIIPRGIDVSDDIQDLFNDLIITTGITDSQHPLFNLRHPVMQAILKSKNPTIDCQSEVSTFNEAINESGSDVLTSIFGKQTKGWLSLFSPFFARSFAADMAATQRAFAMQRKFAALFGKKDQQRQSYAITKFGKTAAQIMKEILHKTGQSHIVRNRIAISSDDVDINNLGEMDQIPFRKLSTTGQINMSSLDGQQSSVITGDELVNWYQYVNPYTSAATYMKYMKFDGANNATSDSSNAKQDKEIAKAASMGSPNSKETYRNILNNGQLKYFIFSPKQALHEYDMISNGTLSGNGNSFHAVTMKTRYGTVVGFYTDKEINERFK